MSVLDATVIRLMALSAADLSTIAVNRMLITRTVEATIPLADCVCPFCTFSVHGENTFIAMS